MKLTVTDVEDELRTLNKPWGTAKGPRLVRGGSETVPSTL